MLTRKQLREMHAEAVPMHILELDYIQTILLKGMFRSDDLVFKGGTCLRKVYGLNRFSEDLDFSTEMGETEVLNSINKGLDMLDRTGINARLWGWKVQKTAFLGKVSYQGPLFTGSKRSEGSISLDFSKFPLKGASEWRAIMTEYPDTGTFFVQCMGLEEILAEKYRALVQRGKPRDLFDIWFIRKKGIEPSLEKVNEKMEETGDDRITSLKDTLSIIQQKEWVRDLGPLLDQLIPLQTIIEDLKTTV